ncbi:dual specificity phosphatase, catalytic domain protein [Oesophagostomum dentatum]|uniref:Dual specificity phosphatase, catalytic domain protein n=1 Tax=Oesophagostomum dentatum TaxID=61180 RepID=A0A0B1T149_OESDE|nr:dual specificity phosphatase, catalytic domain protein [Oesophagostomum dentatum]
MVTSDTSLVIDSTSPYGRVGSSPQAPSPSSRSHALFSLARFRSRLGTEMNEIIPNLYLGSLRDATDTQQLKKHRIQYVVSVHDLTANHPAHKHLKVLKIQLSDCASADISSHFASTNQFIHAARLKQAAVLVHCLAGVSRSATVVAAYLMTMCDMSFFNAITFMSRKRPVVNPNFGFRMQLCTFADRDMIAQRQRLREYFGPAVFDAQWAVDRAITRSKIFLDHQGSSSQAALASTSVSAAAVATVSASSQNGPRSTNKSADMREGAVAPVVQHLPIRKVIARAVPLPQTLRVQLTHRNHNPTISGIEFIDG